MNREEITQTLIQMVNDPEIERLSAAELSGLATHVLETNFYGLSEQAVGALFIVAASLMRDHVDAVEKDILFVRSLMRSKQ